MIIYYGWILLLAAFIALIRSIMVAIKLVDIYDMDENPVVTKVTSTPMGKAKEDSSLGACCICVIFIFIIFAFVAIL